MVALSLLAVELHTLVYPLLEGVCNALPEDEADHDSDELYQVETAETQRILKIKLCNWIRFLCIFLSRGSQQTSYGDPTQWTFINKIRFILMELSFIIIKYNLV